MFYRSLLYSVVTTLMRVEEHEEASHLALRGYRGLHGGGKLRAESPMLNRS